MNEIHAEIRAGPRSRRQRQDTQQLVQTLRKAAHEAGLAAQDALPATQHRDIHGRKVLYRH